MLSRSQRLRLPIYLLTITGVGVVLGLPANAWAVPVTFVSDTSWSVFQSGVPLGNAQLVCLNATTPSGCPAGATLYGASSGWSANLSSIPGAWWIWAPGITGSSPVSFVPYSFFQQFNLSGSPVSGTIAIAADDFAEVVVNGNLVGTVGSVSDSTLASAAQSALTTFDLTPNLVSGPNTITIIAENGNFGCGTTAYSCNPAGVVFGGSLDFTPSVVPEPSTFALMASGIPGFVGLAWLRRRKATKPL
jgi:hypothetical protein